MSHQTVNLVAAPAGGRGSAAEPRRLGVKVRSAVLLLAVAAVNLAFAGCRLPARYRSDASAPSAIQQAGLNDLRQNEDGERAGTASGVRHADATSELPGQVEHAAEMTDGDEDSPSDRPSRWSRLIDRLRPARRMPLPLSPEDPDAALQDEVSAF